MTEKLSKKEIINRIKSGGFRIIEGFNYINQKTKVHIEDSEGYRYYVSCNGIYRSMNYENSKHNLHIIHKGNPYSPYNINLWMIKNNFRSKFISVNYTTGRDRNIKLVCEYGHEFLSSFDILRNVTGGSGCTVCSGMEVVMENSFGYLFPDLLEQWSIKNTISPYEITWGNSDIQIYWICQSGHRDYLCTLSNKRMERGCPSCVGKITDENNLEVVFPEILNEWDYNLNGSPKNYAPYSGKKVSWICSRCYYNFHSYISNRTLHNTGCPRCSESSDAEYIIEKWLTEQNITNVPEKRFENCKDKYTLPFDFYIPDYNICIEYDGIQHFKAQKYFGGEKKLKDQRKKDKIKTRFCKTNNIFLLRIPYWDFDNIEEILTETFLK